MSPDVPPAFSIRTATSAAELEAVFRFRYEHHFRFFQRGYPGVDHARQRVFEPHDLESEHTCAFDAQDRLVAVSTATSADAPSAPALWTPWFALDRLRPLGLHRMVVSTRMVILPELRGNGLFRSFYQALVGGYVRSGLLASLHYSRPGLVNRYERLGHRIYAAAFNLPGGELRLPMLMAFNDVQWLERTHSPLAALSAACGVPAPVADLYAALPELTERQPLHLLPAEAQSAYVEQRLQAAAGTGGGWRGPLPGEGIAALRQASPLRLAAGQTLHAEQAEAQLGFVLAGRIREEQDCGARRLGPGEFLGAGCAGPGLGCAYTAAAETPAELLVFDSGLARRALGNFSASPAAAPALWRALGATSGIPTPGAAPAMAWPVAEQRAEDARNRADTLATGSQHVERHR